jgi:hypothetical protein
MKIIYPLTLLASINLYSEDFLGYGDIIKGQLWAHNNTQSLKVSGNNQAINETKSHLKFNPLLHFQNTSIKECSLNISKPPFIQSSKTQMHGILIKTQQGYELNNLSVDFDTAIPCFNTAFNDISKQFYVNKPVFALVNTEQTPALITAIIEDHLISPEFNHFSLSPTEAEKIQKNPLNFLTREIFNHQHTNNNQSFKVTIEQTSTVESGDNVLIIVLGGRTGDDFEAAAGHLSMGFGKLDDDLKLNAEVANFYPRFAEKGIIPAHTHLVDFFGGLTIGQANYRPNYCLIFYGITQSKIDTMRETFGRALHYMRSSNDPVGTTHNCGTTTWITLNSIGFTGSHNPHTQQTKPPYYPEKNLNHYPGKYSALSTLYATHKNSVGEAFPRIAFEQISASRKALKAKRIDFIFHAQTPSDRALGGTPIRTFENFFWFRKMQKKKEKIERLNTYSPVSINQWVKKIIDWRLKH